MTTKLDELVGYLAGRDGEPRLLEELAEPESEISRFLEETRRRSRALVPDPRPSPTAARPKTTRASVGPLILAGGVAAVVFALAFWFFDQRLREIEEQQSGRAAEAREAADRLESALNQLLESRTTTDSLTPIVAAIGRVDSRLETLEQRMKESDSLVSSRRAEQMALKALEEIANFRLDLAAADKLRARQNDELQGSIHEVGRVLRLLINRLDPPPPTTTDPSRNHAPSRASGTNNPR